MAATVGALILTGSTAAAATATGLTLLAYNAVGYLATTALTSVVLSGLMPKPNLGGGANQANLGYQVSSRGAAQTTRSSMVRQRWGCNHL